MLCFWVILLIKSRREENFLYKNYKISIVKIRDVNIYGGEYYLQYSYPVRSNVVRSQTKLGVGNTNLNYLRFVFVGNDLLLAIDSTNESNNKLLLNIHDFKKFNQIPNDTMLSLFRKIDTLRTDRFD